MAVYNQILVAIDGSNTSAKALDEAIRLAQISGARLRLLHVIDELAYVNGFESAVNYLSEIVPLMHQAGDRILAAARQRALDKGVGADTVLVVEGPGRICDHVAEQAQLARADLIVVGSHGRRGLGRALLGSDAEQIVRNARVPVLVVRGVEQGAEAARSD